MMRRRVAGISSERSGASDDSRPASCISLGRLQAMRGACSEANASVGRGRALAEDLGLLYGQVAGAEAAAFVAVAGDDFVVADQHLADAHILVERRGDRRAATRIAAERAAVLGFLGSVSGGF